MTQRRIVTIASRDNASVVHWRRLARDAVLARREGLIWIEGDHLIGAALQAGWVVAQMVVSERGRADPRCAAMVEQAEMAAFLPDAVFDQVATLESPASMAALLKRPNAPALVPDAMSLILDRVQDPGNVGSILRSAAAFGFAQVLALKGTAALWSTKVVRAGMGAHFSLHLVEQLDDEQLDALTVPLLGTSSHASEILGTRALPRPCAWVVGHEGQGVSDALLARCQRVVKIGQPGGQESLNVAVAAALCMHESIRKPA